MKPATPYFALTLTLAAVLGAANAGPVLDTDGNPLLPNVGYYVLPHIWALGGGLRLAGRGSKPCPLDVVQSPSEVDNGYPVKFSNWKPKVGFVPESQDLNIEVAAGDTKCHQPTYWWLDQQLFVTTGHEPGPHRSFFKIEKSERSEGTYKFVFCHLQIICRGVGRFTDEEGIRRLVLSEEPYEVVFVKAGETEQVL